MVKMRGIDTFGLTFLLVITQHVCCTEDERTRGAATPETDLGLGDVGMRPPVIFPSSSQGATTDSHVAAATITRTPSNSSIRPITSETAVTTNDTPKSTTTSSTKKTTRTTTTTPETTTGLTTTASTTSSLKTTSTSDPTTRATQRFTDTPVAFVSHQLTTNVASKQPNRTESVQDASVAMLKYTTLNESETTTATHTSPSEIKEVNQTQSASSGVTQSSGDLEATEPVFNTNSSIQYEKNNNNTSNMTDLNESFPVEDFTTYDTFWPIAMALTIGIPAIAVFGVTIAVLYRNRLGKPRGLLAAFDDEYNRKL
ncbi:hypothetical protein MAR_025072 [Mya arenaria]|uniref:Mucin-5AC-like n=1 Tax=Mya arenaria TaxID=6604 RepID=A0ABY7DVM7_MYAAR|nr:uncharacterized protein LOC128229294 [Mya arenaria]WAR00700.1 hypothetical protein MAR_025072 [Mya arenaria]